MENRTLAQFPQMSPLEEGWINEFESYLNDQIGFRELSLKIYASAKLVIFNESPMEEQYLVGRNNWYYLNMATPYYRGLASLSETELENISRYLDDRETYLEEKGIEYYYFGFPEKQTIYPEFLPRQIENSSLDSRSYATIIQNHLELQNYDVEFHDLTEKLLTAKSENVIWRSDDSHWNDYGAYVLYLAIMEVLAQDFPELEYVGLEEVKFIDTELLGHISESFGIEEKISTPKYDLSKVCAVLDKNVRRYSGDTIEKRPHIVVNPCAQNDLRVIVFRDSFFLPNILLFANSFSETLFLRNHSPYATEDLEQLIQKFDPDIIIEAKVDRAFGRTDEYRNVETD